MKLNTLRHAALLTCLASGMPVYALDASTKFDLVRLGLVDSAHTRADGWQVSSVQLLNDVGQAAGYSSRFSGSTDLGLEAWLFNGAVSAQIGLVDAAHTRSDGYRLNWVLSLNNAGQVIGRSNRYNGNASGGASAWAFDGSVTQQIGLVDMAHIRADGYQVTNVVSVNNAGQALGYSERYNGNSQLGQNTWLFNGGVTQQIGLIDAAHTSANGHQYSYAGLLNNSGQAAGNSGRFNGNTGSGQSAWLFNGSVTQKIGLVDAAHTRVDGFQVSEAMRLNDVGQAAGISIRYNGNTSLGANAWLFNGSVTQQIGLVDAAHTRTDGYQNSYATVLNDVGQAAGFSIRFNGNTGSGQSAWLFNGSVTQKIGLVDAAHTRADGYQMSEVGSINNAGQAVGYSWRYNGYAQQGRHAWLFDGSVTQQIGLVDAIHTHVFGEQYSSVQQLNDAGQAIGFSSRYNGYAEGGQSAWFFNDGVTEQIGLVDAAHTRADGYQYSWAQHLNNAGQAVGQSYLFNSDGHAGEDAWFYDDDLNQTIALTFSKSANGKSNSYVEYLGEDGLLLGRYRLYDGSVDKGYRAFAWSLDSGFLDLGLAINDGLELDWTHLALAHRGNTLGQIIGNGQLAKGGQGAFLLTPAVPEPESYAMVLAGLGIIAAMRRRRVSVRH